MRKILILSAVFFTALAPYAHATVRINEIAWMGTAANANAEWIELANTDASPISLAKWKLTSESSSPTITLTGTIPANGFYLLERTSDITVPDVKADQIYTGALSNAGATLILADASGAQVDQVVGGANWAGVGGDNKTKDTAQRTDNGWITAPPTPRAQNATTPSAPPPMKLKAGTASISNKQRTQTALAVSTTDHATDAVNAPAVTTDVAAAGAALPAADVSVPSPAPKAPGAGLLHSPWTFGLLGVIAFAAGAFMIL